jgi:pyruvate dehydrogenase E2 component (dihydrolipoamide acetyltransferase)
MAKILEMPKLSPTMEEGVLSAWHKKEGDAIAIDDLLADVETDKATMEFRAFDKGTLLKHLVPAGALVKLGQPVAVVGGPNEDVSALIAQAGVATAAGGAPPRAATEAPPTRPEEKKSAPQPSSPLDAGIDPTPAPRPPTAPAAATRTPRAAQNALDRTEHEPERTPKRSPIGDRVLASPYVRKIAREMGVDLAGALGSGPSGRIAAKDVERLRENGASRTLTRSPTPGASAPGMTTTAMTISTPPAGLLGPEARPLSMMRKTIARRLTESKQTVPHFYLTIDVDADEIVHLRERINAELAFAGPSQPRRANGGDNAPPPDKVSINDLIVKACAVALTRVPECNAQFSPEAILIFKRIDISVAVAVPDGLVTPVVRNADSKSVVGIAREVRELAGRARAKKLLPEEMANGTFSISNLGMFGIDSFSAVINPPEGAILAVGQVREEPVIKDGRVVAGRKLALTLSADHRVVDGAVGAAFLAELRALLERPMRVLTG